eukprot:2811049-Pleurochrysis_carterae.AAC.2
MKTSQRCDANRMKGVGWVEDQAGGECDSCKASAGENEKAVPAAVRAARSPNLAGRKGRAYHPNCRAGSPNQSERREKNRKKRPGRQRARRICKEASMQCLGSTHADLTTHCHTHISGQRTA